MGAVVLSAYISAKVVLDMDIQAQNETIYKDTMAMMSGLSDNELLLIKEFIIRLGKRKEVREDSYNPYKPLTREEIIERLAVSRKHAENGRVMSAHKASENVREKYGL